MSKVLFLVNHDMSVYNFRLELVESLLASGHKVVISSPYGERIGDLKAIGCEYHEIEFFRHGMNPIEEISLICAYRKLLKEVEPDVVFSYTIKPNIYGAMVCKELKIPCVANITGLGTALENESIVQKILILLYRYAFTEIQSVFFQNKENMCFFEKHRIAVGKHKLLPGSGVNLSRFAPIAYPQDAKVEFAFISRIMKEKGIDQYLAAAKSIRKRYHDTVFHVCGFCEQDYEKQLSELSGMGVIIYHGMVRDVQTVFENIHCVVHPTYYPEGMSNVLLEASASARPIITTDRAGCREIIDDGINGFICKQQDSEDLILQIEKFLSLSNKKRKEMGLAGRRKVEKEFDRQIIVNAYMRELEFAQKAKDQKRA